MRTGATLLFVVALATPIRSVDAKDIDAFRGPWNLVELTMGGKSVENVENELAVVIRGDKIEFYSVGQKEPINRLHIVVDSTVTPKAIDFHEFDKGKRGDKIAEGLYEIDGDKLRICLKQQSGPPWNRP